MKYTNIIGGLATKEDCTWVCNHCNNTVESMVVSLGERIYFRKVRCHCGKAEQEYAAELLAKAVAERKKQVEELIKQSSIPTELADFTFDNFDENSPHLIDGEFVKYQVRDYCQTVKSKQKNFLVLSGKFGAGKTHLAIACEFYVMENRLWKSKYANWPALLKLTREGFNNATKRVLADAQWDKLKHAHISLIDDLDKGKPSAWVMEQLYDLVEYRYSRKMPTIFTINRDLFTLADYWSSFGNDPNEDYGAIADHGGAVADRIFGQLWRHIPIEITQSYRTL